MKFKLNIEGLEKESFNFFNKGHKDRMKQRVLRVRSYDDPK